MFAVSIGFDPAPLGSSILWKYNKNTKCICGEKMSPEHIILHCKVMEVLLPKHKETSLHGFFSINNTVLLQ